MSLIFAALLTKVNDITTSFDSPPAFNYIQTLDAHRGKSLAYPKDFQAKQLHLYPDLKPLSTKNDAAQVFVLVSEVAKVQPDWEIVNVDVRGQHLEAVATTGLLHFKDDVVIEVRTEQGQSAVHMRSRSRIGRSDFAANFKRIESFFSQLEKRF